MNIFSYIIGIACCLLALISSFLKGKKAGKEQEQNKQNKEVLKSVKKSVKAINNISYDNDYDRLRKKYLNK